MIVIVLCLFLNVRKSFPELTSYPWQPVFHWPDVDHMSQRVGECDLHDWIRQVKTYRLELGLKDISTQRNVGNIGVLSQGSRQVALGKVIDDVLYMVSPLPLVFSSFLHV